MLLNQNHLCKEEWGFIISQLNQNRAKTQFQNH